MLADARSRSVDSTRSVNITVIVSVAMYHPSPWWHRVCHGPSRSATRGSALDERLRARSQTQRRGRGVRRASMLGTRSRRGRPLVPREDVDVEVPEALVAGGLVVLPGRRAVAVEGPLEPDRDAAGEAVDVESCVRPRGRRGSRRAPSAPRERGPGHSAHTRRETMARARSFSVTTTLSPPSPATMLQTKHS